MKNYEFCIFDCDGVVLDSNKIKTQAFREALPLEPHDKVKKLIDFHLLNGGVSRYEKFQYYFKNIKYSQDLESDLQKALDKFAAYAYNKLLKCDLVPGVIQFLEKMNNLDIKCYVNSGSDEVELNEVFKERGIINLFKEIKGSPNTKDKNTASIIRAIGRERRGVFFGDSKSDYLSAKKFSLDFIFISGYSEWKNPSGDFTDEFENFLSLSR
jgi:phosphoglycolate phosphatase-like HAD superfamily hydrolase